MNHHTNITTLQSLVKERHGDVFFIGGFLRDRLLGVDSNDIDFVVKNDVLELAERLAKGIEGGFVVLDEENVCARVVKKTDDGLLTYDFAQFRADTIEGDIAKRDFTINTFYAPLSSWSESGLDEEAIQSHESARDDLKNKVVALVYEQAFQDDPLRLLRAYSLSAKYDFEIIQRTQDVIRRDVNLIEDVSVERVRDEFLKILNTSRAFQALTAMDDIGLLLRMMPQLRVMKDVFQGGYHHLDVWKHSLEVVHQFDQLVDCINQGGFISAESSAEISDYLRQSLGSDQSRLALIKLACLLHDIGKPDTKKMEEERISFHSHEHVGADIARVIARKLKLSTKQSHALEDMVRLHLRPGYLSNFDQPTDKAVYRFFRKAKDEALSILLLSLADQRSTCGELTTQDMQDHHEKICCQAIVQWLEEQKKEELPRLVTGEDLIETFGLKPSHMFRDILEKVEEAQALGEITSKEEAFALTKQLIDELMGANS